MTTGSDSNSINEYNHNTRDKEHINNLRDSNVPVDTVNLKDHLEDWEMRLLVCTNIQPGMGLLVKKIKNKGTVRQRAKRACHCRCSKRYNQMTKIKSHLY